MTRRRGRAHSRGFINRLTFLRSLLVCLGAANFVQSWFGGGEKKAELDEEERKKGIQELLQKFPESSTEVGARCKLFWVVESAPHVVQCLKPLHGDPPASSAGFNWEVAAPYTEEMTRFLKARGGRVEETATMFQKHLGEAVQA